MGRPEGGGEGSVEAKHHSHCLRLRRNENDVWAVILNVTTMAMRMHSHCLCCNENDVWPVILNVTTMAMGMMSLP